MTRTRANISRRDNKKTPAVHPTPPSNQSSAFASVLGGMASGFGFEIRFWARVYDRNARHVDL